jgi:membrane protease YdiL (CAAX protease family)
MGYSTDSRGRAVWGALLRVTVFALLFLICVRIGTLLTGLLVTAAPGDVRARTAIAITGSLLGQLIAAGFLLAWVFRTGRDFRWLGLQSGAPAKVWLLAAGIALGWALLVWNGVLAGMSGFDELSLWRVSLAVGAGLIGGTCEELVFRGAVIQSVAEARGSRSIQFAAGSLLFGLAHLGWAALAGNAMAGLAAAIFTAMLGAALSFLFLWGRRSLWPCIAAHALINVAIEPWLVFAMMQGKG